MATVLDRYLKRSTAYHNSAAAELTACRHRRTAKPPKQTLAKPAAKCRLRPASPNLPGAALAAKCPPTNWAKSGRGQRKKKFKKKSRAKPIACKIRGSPENFATLLDPPGPPKNQKKNGPKAAEAKGGKKEEKKSRQSQSPAKSRVRRKFPQIPGTPPEGPKFSKKWGLQSGLIFPEAVRPKSLHSACGSWPCGPKARSAPNSTRSTASEKRAGRDMLAGGRGGWGRAGRQK